MQNIAVGRFETFGRNVLFCVRFKAFRESVYRLAFLVLRASAYFVWYSVRSTCIRLACNVRAFFPERAFCV
jgi:hypothetical protein